VFLSDFGMSVMLASENEFDTVASLSNSWKSLRSVGILQKFDSIQQSICQVLDFSFLVDSIAALISLHVIDLFRSYVSRNVSISLDFPFYLNISFQSSLDDSLDFLGICCYRSLFISGFITFSLFPPHFSEICQLFVNLIHFNKEPAFFVLLIMCKFFGGSISLILTLIFIISLFLLVLGLACSSFSRSLRCSIMSFI
jgi:hypothetical protein